MNNENMGAGEATNRNTIRDMTLTITIAILVTIVLVTASELISWQLVHFTTVPFGDMIRSLEQLQLFLSHQIGGGEYLVTPSNEHVMATSRVIYLLDWQFARGTGLFAVACSYFLVTMIAATMAVALLYWTRGLAWQARAALISVVVQFWLNGHHLMNLNWAFQVAHWIATCLAWLAALSFAGAELVHSPRVRLALKASLLPLSFLAIITLGNGAIILPVLVILAMIDRWKWTDIAWMSIIAVLGVYFYLWLAGTTGSNIPPIAGWNIASMAAFVLLYIGGPFIRLLSWPSNMEAWSSFPTLGNVFGGAILLIGGAALLARIRNPRAGGALVTAGLALIGIVTATGILAALSRSSLGIEEATNKKYAAFATLAWCGTAFILAAVLVHQWRQRFRSVIAAAAVCGALVLAIFIWASQAKEFVIFEKWNKRLDESATSIQFSANDREYDNTIYFDLSRIRKLAESFLKPNRAAFYAFGRPMMDQILDAPIRDLGCFGNVDALTATPESDGGAATRAFRMQGWSWIKQRRKPPSIVVVIDASNRVRGLATMTRSAPIVDELVFAAVSKRSDAGFFGFFVPSGSGPYRVLAVDSVEGDACQIAQFAL
jgi:hypothetical protein